MERAFAILCVCAREYDSTVSPALMYTYIKTHTHKIVQNSLCWPFGPLLSVRIKFMYLSLWLWYFASSTAKTPAESPFVCTECFDSKKKKKNYAMTTNAKMFLGFWQEPVPNTHESLHTPDNFIRIIFRFYGQSSWRMQRKSYCYGQKIPKSTSTWHIGRCQWYFVQYMTLFRISTGTQCSDLFNLFVWCPSNTSSILKHDRSVYIATNHFSNDSEKKNKT